VGQGLAGDIAAALHGMPLPSGISASAGASPAVLEHLPAAIRDGYIAGFAQALHTVFLDATPVGAVAFLLSLTLEEVPLRDTVPTVDRAQSPAATSTPATPNSAQEMEREPGEIPELRRPLGRITITPAVTDRTPERDGAAPAR
jgi:hypothetical protein